MHKKYKPNENKSFYVGLDSIFRVSTKGESFGVIGAWLTQIAHGKDLEKILQNQRLKTMKAMDFIQFFWPNHLTI